MPRDSAAGLAPSTTCRCDALRIARASSIAVVVPSPRKSSAVEATSRSSWTPWLVIGSWSMSTERAIVTPSLVTSGGASKRCSTT